MGYNKTILEGHLTRDIEMKYTQGGTAIANTAIATSRKYKTQTGEQKEEVLFVDLTFLGRNAEIANQFLKKGSHVLVDGRLKLDQWTAQDGTKRSKHSITIENMQMLGNKADSASGASAGQPGVYGQPAQNNQPTPEQAAPHPAPAYNHPPAAAPGAPTYNPPAPQNTQGHPGAAPVQTSTPGQPQQPKYQLQPGQEPGPGQYEVGRAPNGASIVMSEDEIPF